MANQKEQRMKRMRLKRVIGPRLVAKLFLCWIPFATPQQASITRNHTLESSSVPTAAGLAIRLGRKPAGPLVGPLGLGV